MTDPTSGRSKNRFPVSAFRFVRALPGRFPKTVPTLLAVILVAWGGLLCFVYGRLGFMPLDQSIVFDGGWRMASGQVPFRDFDSPNAIIPAVIQAVFFKLFGVSWLAYILHAAIFNGLFCLLVYLLLRMLGGGRLLAFFYALLSGVVFYPPFGVPYMDQHAFFFVLLAIAAVVFAVHTRPVRKKILGWALAPVVVVLAYLSKQIPTNYAVPLIVLLLLATTGKIHFRRMALTTAVSVGSIVLVIFAAGASLGIDPARLKASFLEMPAQVGRERLSWIFATYSPFQIVKGFFYPHPLGGFSLKLHSLDLAYLSVLAVLVLSALSRIKMIRAGRTIVRRKTALPLILAVGLSVVANLFVMSTLNQGENGVPYLFVSLGLTQIAWTRLLSSPSPSRKNAGVKYALAALFAVVAVLDAASFNARVNRTRMVQDINIRLGPRSMPASKEARAGLGFGDFTLPSHYAFNLEDIEGVLDFFKARQGNFFLIGDTSILYGLTGRPSVNPSLWFHPGISMPAPGSEEFRRYEERVMENIKKYRVTFVVLEGRQTWFGISFENFKKLGSLVIADSGDNARFGPFEILRIDPDKIRE